MRGGRQIAWRGRLSGEPGFGVELVIYKQIVRIRLRPVEYLHDADKSDAPIADGSACSPRQCMQLRHRCHQTFGLWATLHLPACAKIVGGSPHCFGAPPLIESSGRGEVLGSLAGQLRAQQQDGDPSSERSERRQVTGRLTARKWLFLAAVSVGGFLLLVAWLGVPLLDVPTVRLPENATADDVARTQAVTDRLRVANTARASFLQVLLQAVGGSVLVAGAVGTWRTVTLNRERLDIDRTANLASDEARREAQITELYTRAVHQMGHEDPGVRTGGVYALERIARDSSRDRLTVVAVLGAFLRRNASRLSDDSHGDFLGSAKPDIQAAISALSRISRPGELNLPRINLAQADLRGADLTAVRLGGVNLMGADLRESRMAGSLLNQGDLSNARLNGANLRDAALVGAKLVHADLHSADLSGADLSGAECSGARLISANLAGANLHGADLTGANLHGADLSDATLADGSKASNGS